MEINVHDDTKMVDIWLTREEQSNPELRKRMKPLYQDFVEKKYTVAVFLSGDRELTEETSALLRYNKRRIAELEVQQEKREPEPPGFTMAM